MHSAQPYSRGPRGHHPGPAAFPEVTRLAANLMRLSAMAMRGGMRLAGEAMERFPGRAEGCRCHERQRRDCGCDCCDVFRGPACHSYCVECLPPVYPCRCQCGG